jgi:hypothetical protein
LQVGPRDEMLARANCLVACEDAAGHAQYVYGDTQHGGLGLITVLRFHPESIGLPVQPASLSSTIRLWQDVVQPATAGLSGLALAVTAGAFVIARRNHQRELAQEAEGRAQDESESVEPPPLK